MSNKLEEAAIQKRNELVAMNESIGYGNSTDANNYTATHTKALSDSETPIKGKGTGVFLDTFNGGSDADINGVGSAAGSGRIPAIAKNGGDWGYTPDSYYGHPDTSDNVGQVSFE